MNESVSTSIMAPSGSRRLSLSWEASLRTGNPDISYAGDFELRSKSRVTLAEHISNYGRIPTGLSLNMIIETLRVANLTGRGGARFPMYRKIDAVANARTKKAIYIVANGSESEPLSRKDSSLLRANPHLVLDGMSIIAEVLGAKAGYIYVKDKEAHVAINAALRERRDRGINEVRVSVVEAPPGYVSGQETSVVRRIERGPALPRFSTDRLATSGIKGAPTLLSNVETFANAALILRFGGDWYRSGGVGYDSGTRLLTISGSVARPGVYEVNPGVSVAALLREAGASSVRALLVGGYFGGWINVRDESDLNFSFDDHTLADRKLNIGAGIIGVLSKDTCPVVEAAGIVEYLSRQSAGQCGPCIFGLPEISTAFARIALSSNVEKGIAELRSVIPLVEHRGGCQHPDGVIGLVRSTVGAFGDEIKLHKSGNCSVVGVNHRSVLLPTPKMNSGMSSIGGK